MSWGVNTRRSHLGYRDRLFETLATGGACGHLAIKKGDRMATFCFM